MLNATHLAGALLAITALTAPVAAQWSDNFDSYASGTLLHNVGGWYGWYNTPAAAGTADNAFSRSAPNSIRIDGSADAVQPNLGATSGRWTLTLWQYIPTGGLTANTFVILNSVYSNSGAPTEWTGQFRCNPSGMVEDTLRINDDYPQPVVFDQWVEWRMEIDLDRNTMDAFYNNKRISQGTYNIGPSATRPTELQNLDLFTTGGTCYYDDISLTQPTDNFGVSFEASAATSTATSTTATFWVDEPAAANGNSVPLYSVTNSPPFNLGFVSGQLHLNFSTLVALPVFNLDANGRGSLPVANYPALGLQFFGWFQAFNLPTTGTPFLASDPIAAGDGDDGASDATISYNHSNGRYIVSYHGPTSCNIVHVDAAGTKTTLGSLALGGCTGVKTLGFLESIVVEEAVSGTPLTFVKNL